ncbi:AAA family ATPase [Kutzneria sp. CA-103260]|uniref:AAA family ATPase n=1 Tax=Kutzneria sp. CA-103260 TaxID=2802641 RepID=UPI001BA54256|nr:AAA family ATPase [Kutzneria sp. CA-103260]
MSFVRRTEQLATLHAAFADADRGRGRVVVVTGGLAGGKTALLERYCDSALSEGALVLTATGARAERRLRMGLIDQLFNTAALPVEVLERASRLLFADAATTDDVDEHSTLRQSDARTVRALCDLLLELAKTGPVVIGVDDVHFADEASLQVLLYLCRRLNRTRILLILTEWARPLSTQPLFDAEVTRLPHKVVELAPLSVDGIADLVAELAGQPVSAATARHVHLLTGGNPLLAQALVSDNDGGLDGPLAVGAAFRQAVLSCLHRWEPRLLMVARAVAVLGEHATAESTAALTGLASVTVTPIMEVLADAGLLMDYQFRHEQSAAAVLDAMSPRERTWLHLGAAEFLYQRGASAPEVSSHLIAGGAVPGPWAVSVLRDAATQALADDDVALVVAALDLALTSCADEQESAAITELLARALWRLNPALAAPRLTPLLQALHERRLGPANATTAVRHLLWQGVFDQHLEDVTAVHADIGHDAIAFLLGHQWIYGKRASCVELLNSNEPSPWFEAALSLCNLFYEGPTEQIVRNATHILRSCRLSDSTVEIIVGSLFALLHADESDLAEHWCTALLAEATERGAATWQALLTATYADVLLRKGDLEQAVTLAESALRVLPGPGWGVLVSLPLTVLLTACTALGRHEQVEELSGHVVPAAAENTLLGVRYLRARGHHRLGTGQVLGALSDFGKCGARLPAWNLDLPEVLPWRTDLAQAHLQMGNQQLAFELATEELRLCQRPRSRAVATRVLASCSELRRRPALLDSAIDALQESGDRLELARAMAELSKAYDELGDFSRARIVARSADQQARAFAAVVESTTVTSIVRDRADDGGPVLSDAELRVARLAARGHTNREISHRLSITASTVEQHLTRVYRKLKVKSRADLPGRLSVASAAAEPVGVLRAVNCQ